MNVNAPILELSTMDRLNSEAIKKEKKKSSDNLRHYIECNVYLTDIVAATVAA